MSADSRPKRQKGRTHSLATGQRHVIEMWPLDRLKPNPKQAEFFSNMSDAELEDLAMDIDANGLRDPVEVRPDGTIISGHQRWLAYQRLGRTEIPVVVCHDLHKQGEDAIEYVFLSANALRRNPRKLERARVALRRNELLDWTEGVELSGELRDHLGAICGVTGRHFSRWVRILRETPREIQDAFDRGEITLKLAERVLELTDKAQMKLVELIRQGRTPKTAILLCSEPVQRQTPAPRRARKQLLQALSRATQDLNGQVHNTGHYTDADIGILREGVRLINELLQLATTTKYIKGYGM